MSNSLDEMLQIRLILNILFGALVEVLRLQDTKLMLENTTHKIVWNPSLIDFQSVGIGTWKSTGYIPNSEGSIRY
jgi:hypothetical protein